jgi:hypothetical protein
MSDPSQLVYVSNLGSERYFVELESAPLSGSSVPYRVAGTYDNLTRDALLVILTNHLKNSNASGVTR